MNRIDRTDGILERLKKRYRLIERYLRGIHACLYAEYYGTLEGKDRMEDLYGLLREIEQLEGLLNLQLFSEKEYSLLDEICRKRGKWFHKKDSLFIRKADIDETDRDEIIRDLGHAEEVRMILLDTMIRLESRRM
jgi:hypothetical protein